MKIIIWDFIGQAETWLASEANWQRIEIAYKLNDIKELKFVPHIVHNVPHECLLIFENGQRQAIENLIPQIGIKPEKVIFALNIESWVDHFDFANYLLKSGSRFFLNVKCNKLRAESPLFMVDLPQPKGGGIHYISSSQDTIIMPQMYISQCNFSMNEMIVFYHLAKKYYPNRKKDGYFLDLGANIGTTCIYFKKQLDNDVKILAFEPLEQNYHFLNINLMLNDIKDAKVEKLGLSDSSTRKMINRMLNNPGGSSLVWEHGQGQESVELISLDEYFSKHSLKAEDIKYMWIDTEGFEPYVLSGSRHILKSAEIPLFIEFSRYSPEAYTLMIEILTEVYTNFILIPEMLRGAEILHPIIELEKFKKMEHQEFFDIFFIK